MKMKSEKYYFFGVAVFGEKSDELGFFWLSAGLEMFGIGSIRVSSVCVRVCVFACVIDQIYH